MSKEKVFEVKKAEDIFGQVSEYNHELVLFCNDNSTGLKAIIAVHNTTLGPSMGGLRMWPYESEKDALFDVLRLSRGMTLKNSLAGINVGGGKAVIIGDARKQKNEFLLRRFGKFVNNLGGKYYTAEDVGMSAEDMEFVGMETPYVTGMPIARGGSGDPSPVTAYGVYLGIKASLKKTTGSDSLDGKRILVQGVGHVGSHLVNYLVKENAKVFIYDIYPETLNKVAKETGAEIISEDQIFTLPVDVFAPCALGGALNPETIPMLNCSIVAGAANNQLLDEIRDAKALQARGILYAPDFMVNAGGIINVSLELDVYNKDIAMRMTERIYETTLKTFKMAEDQNITTHQAALQMANDRIDAVGRNMLFR